MWLRTRGDGAETFLLSQRLEQDAILLLFDSSATVEQVWFRLTAWFARYQDGTLRDDLRPKLIFRVMKQGRLVRLGMETTIRSSTTGDPNSSLHSARAPPLRAKVGGSTRTVGQINLLMASRPRKTISTCSRPGGRSRNTRSQPWRRTRQYQNDDALDGLFSASHCSVWAVAPRFLCVSSSSAAARHSSPGGKCLSILPSVARQPENQSTICSLTSPSLLFFFFSLVSPRYDADRPQAKYLTIATFPID